MAYRYNAAGQVIDDAGTVIFDPKYGGYDPIAHPAGSAPPPPQGATESDLRYIRNPTIPVQYDPQKRLSYTVSYSGEKNYIPDESVVPKPKSGFVHGAASWDPLTGTYKQGLNGGGLGGLLEGAAALAGGSGAFGLIGAGGGSTLPSSSIPASALMNGPATASANLAASGAATSAAPIGSILPSAAIPGMDAAVPGSVGSAANTAGAAAGGAGAAAGAGGAASNLVSQLTSGKGLTSLAALIPALMKSAGGNGSGSNGLSPDFVQQAYNDAKANNDMVAARYRRVDPLQQAVTQLAFSRLPTSATQGIALTPVPLPPQQG